MTDEVVPEVPAPVVQEAPPFVSDPVQQVDVHEVAVEVLAGHWGRGNVRRGRLEKAGYDVDAVLDEVNKILSR